MSESRRVRLKIRFTRKGAPRSEEVLIDQLPCRIGRGASNQIDLGDASVSSNHAVLEWDETSGGIVLRDLGSRNGIRRNDRLEVIKNGVIPLDGDILSFVLGVLQVDIENLDFANSSANPTATVDLGRSIKKRKEQTLSGPQVAVTPGLVSSGGPQGGIRNIRLREPTGGIRVDRAARGLNGKVVLGRDNNGGQLRFERRARHDSVQSNGRRKRDAGLFWFGMLAVVGGSALSSQLLIDSGLSEVIPAVLDKYLLVVIALIALCIILLFSMVLVGLRFLFRRDDIDFGALFMQVSGAFGMAYGVSIALNSGAGFLDLEGQAMASVTIQSVARAGFFLFLFHGFFLLRSRWGGPGFLSRALPWGIALLVLAHSVYRNGVPGEERTKGVAILGEGPLIAPFHVPNPDSGRSPAEVHTVEQAVTEFSIAVQELDARKLQKENEKNSN